MSRQSKIDSFFKSKSSILANLPNTLMGLDIIKSPKKRNLSLKKAITPSKFFKVASCENISISLCSDDEDDHRNFRESGNSDSINSSQDTIIYTPHKSSPQKVPQTPTSSNLRIRSPRSINKYYSPNKKRVIYRESPVKRNLVQQLKETSQQRAVYADDSLKEKYKEHDDKTAFLLETIDKYLHDESLQCLLSEEHKQILEKCMEIDKPSIRLVCRLYWRKDCWYRKDKLKSIIQTNDEVTEVTFTKEIEPLIKYGLINISTLDCNVIMTFEDYCQILNINELKQICKEYKLPNIKSKQAAVTALKKYSDTRPITSMLCTGSVRNNYGRVLHKLSTTVGKCYKLSELARNTIYRLYVLMYLGIDYNIIREKKLELMLINDRINIETYPVDKEEIDSARIVFKNNKDFESYIQIHIAYEKLIEETNASTRLEIIHQMLEEFKNYEENDKSRFKSMPVWLRRFTPMNLIVKILEAGVQDLKKKNDYDGALDILSKLLSQDLYRQHKRAEWYSEKALVLQKLKQNEQAARVLLDGFNTIASEDEKDTMRPRAKRLANAVTDKELSAALLKYADKGSILEKNLPGVFINKQPMENTGSKGKKKFHQRTENGSITVFSVEEFGLNHYLSSSQFTKGKHYEGRMVVTIFFLLFWDIIYTKPADCCGLYLSRFQRYPLDMFSKCFYTNRKKYIEMRINELRTMSLDEILHVVTFVWTSKPDHQLSGINRKACNFEDLKEICVCLGGAGLAAVCGRLARDSGYANSGFPDLTVWNAQTKKIKFVEVKSDSDRPSMKQIQWMHYLQQNGIDTEFGYIGANTARNKARASTTDCLV